METVESNIAQEIDEVKKDVETLAATEGWGVLSEDQRRYIKDSLYVSKRAYREYGVTKNPRYGHRLSDEVAIFPKGQKTPDDSKYTESQNRIADWYCHYSVFVLENNGLEPSITSKKVDKNFAEEKFSKCTGVTDLRPRIEEIGFPCVIQVSGNEDNSELDVDDMVHSFVVFGKNEDGYVCWEKMDLGQRYGVSNLEKIFQENNKDYLYWGVRKLRDLKEKDTSL